MSITTAIGDLLHSFYELFLTIFGTFYNIITGFLMAIVHFFTGILQMVGDILGGFADVAGGIGKFALSKSSLCLWDGMDLVEADTRALRQYRCPRHPRRRRVCVPQLFAPAGTRGAGEEDQLSCL